MILYRILTEDKNRGDILEFINRFFEGYTVLEGTGYWRGQAETCLIIEIITSYHHHDKIMAIAEWIQKHNNQDSVAITTQNIEIKTVGDHL